MAWNDLTNGTVKSAVLLDHNGREIHPQGEEEDRSDGLDLPHIITFPALYRGAAYTYNHLWDEAMKHSRQNALAMRRDAWLMSLLRERADETLSKPWHLEVDNPRDKWQKCVCAGMTKVVRSIHRLKRMQRYLLQGAIWYGRYGSNVKWSWKTMYLPLMQSKGGGMGQPTSSPSMAKGKVLTITKHKPVNGDKIGHHNDDTPYVLINSSFRDKIVGERQVIYPSNAQGPALLLRGTWRDQIIIHTSDPDDADYFEAEMAESVHGVGIRSRIYWLDFLRRDYFGAVTEMLNRIGLGLVVIYYDASNNTAKEEAEKMAKNFSRRSVIVMPRTNDGVSQAGGIEVVETPMAGATIMLDLQKHVEDQIERYVAGQLVSAGGGTSNPLEGTGRAEFAKDTKTKTCLADAMDHDETWTGSDEEPGPVSIIKKWTYSFADFPIRYVTEQEKPNANETLEAVKTVVDMGVELPIEPIRELTGIRAPEEGEETVGGKEEMMALAQMEADAMAPPGGEREGAGRDESPEGVQDVAPAEEYAAEPKRGNPGTKGGPPNAGQFGPGGGGSSKDSGGSRLRSRKQLLAKAAAQGGDTGAGGSTKIDLANKGNGKPGEEEGGQGVGGEAGPPTAEEAIYLDPTLPSTIHDKQRMKNTEEEMGDDVVELEKQLEVIDARIMELKQQKGIQPIENLREESKLRQEYMDIEDRIKEIQKQSEDAEYEEDVKAKAGRRKELGLKYSREDTVINYSAEMSVHDLLDNIRRVGPYAGRDLIHGLLATLKRQPHLRQRLRPSDLALIQALAMSDIEEYEAVFEAMV